MSTLIAGTYTGSSTKIASAILAGYSTPVANGSTVRSALFSNGEKGVWFDPSDFSTLFQDPAGTTPVTAVGQTVGLMLDKRKGLVLGSEMKGSGVPALMGVATAATYNTNTGEGSVSRVDSANQSSVDFSGLTANGFYSIAVSNTGSSNLLIRSGGATGTVLITITPGQSVTPTLAASATGVLSFTANINATTALFTISYFRELPGYHATQTTSTARPPLASHVSAFGNAVYELTGDGVDNALTVATGGGGTTGILLCMAVNPAATAAATLWSDAGTNTGYKLTLNATNNIVLSAGNGTAYTSVTGPVLTAGIEYVVMAWHDGVNLNIQVNGGTVTSAAFGTTTAGTAGFRVMADNGTAANWFNGTVASLIYRQNDTSTATDRANVLAYVNSKAGAY